MATPEERLLDSILSRSYEIEGSEDEEFVYDNAEMNETPLIDEEDREILMHRDAHFSGNFDFMIEAYESGKKSAVLDTTVKRLRTLQRQEQEFQKNLAPLFLGGADAEKIAFARKLYRDLASLFDREEKSIPQSIASLILSEEEEPIAEIKELVSYGPAAITPLLEIVESSLFLDPLFPGYGFAPLHAAFALSKLHAKEAIMPILALMKEAPQFEEELLALLQGIGPEAKALLMKRARGEDDVALQGLLSFADEETSLFCFEMLQLKGESKIAPYYALGCEWLPEEKRREFRELFEKKAFPAGVLEEMKFIIGSWH